MIDELKKIGLSENEAKTYVALLELGSATAQEVSRKSGIKRATTYVQLESLMKFGLVTTFERATGRKNGAPKTYFRGEDPEHLLKIVEIKKKEVEEKASSLGKIMPMLNQLFLSSGERPRVRFFEGVGGLKTIQEEFLKTNDKTVESFSSTDDVLRIFPNIGVEYTKRKVKKEIQSKVIYTSSKGAFLKQIDDENLRESQYVPQDKFPLSCDLAIFGNSVSISVLKGKIFGVVIENKEIAEAVRSLFYLAWEEAKKYQ